MKRYTYHPMHMHLHCCFQAGASMASHMHNANVLGMQYIRFTDHDTRMCRRKNPCNGFDFTKETLVVEDAPGCHCGWQEIYGEPELRLENASMVLSSHAPAGEKKWGGYGFQASDKRHSISLMCDVTLLLEMDVSISETSSVILDVRLSQRPPDHKPAHLYYVFGGAKVPDEPHSVLIPMEFSPDGIYRLTLSEDVQKEGIRDVVGGLDNAFDTISILTEAWDEGVCECRIRRFEIHAETFGQTVLDRQRTLAEEVGKRYGIKPLTTTEISGAGQHKNCFSGHVPIIDYSLHDFSVTQTEAVEHVNKYGGIFSYNHPLDRYKRKKLTPEERNFILHRDAASFLASRLWGATLMEVGFVRGYGPFSFEDHLTLWDLLTLGGLFVTGYGDSDAHSSNINWFDGKNFVAYIAADEAIPFPVPEEEFISSMKAGRVYTGDPVYIKGQVSLTMDALPMGAVKLVSHKDREKHEVVFRAEQCEKDWNVCVVINGERVMGFPAGEKTDENGTLSFSFSLSRSLPVNFARVEMYLPCGRCILLTNPVYLVSKEEFKGEIPLERLYQNDKEKNL